MFFLRLIVFIEQDLDLSRSWKEVVEAVGITGQHFGKMQWREIWVLSLAPRPTLLQYLHILKNRCAANNPLRLKENARFCLYLDSCALK